MLQRCLRYIRNFFGFTRGEARGFSVMALLLVLVYGGWFIWSLFPTEPYHPSTDQRELDSLVSLLKAKDTVSSFSANSIADQQLPLERELFFFDPNTVSHDSLLLLGFPPQLARRLLNYREKGGQFRKDTDLLKLYGIEQRLYQTLEPWIQLPQKSFERKKRQQFAFTEKPDKAIAETRKPFDLNKCDSLQLLSVKGIGPVLSSRILKFREALGGFVAADQLREVWGLTPEVADAVLERAFVPEGEPQRMLPINTADVAGLARHPYVDRRQAEAIVAYRLQNGDFQKPEDLLHIHTLDENFIIKLKPYLQF